MWRPLSRIICGGPTLGCASATAAATRWLCFLFGRIAPHLADPCCEFDRPLSLLAFPVLCLADPLSIWRTRAVKICRGGQ